MKLQTLIEWDGPFPSDMDAARFDNLRVTCLTPGYQVHRYEHKGSWVNLDATISFCLELEIRNTVPPTLVLLAPVHGTSGQTLALPSAYPQRSHAMSTTPAILDVPFSHPNDDWRQVHDELKTNDTAWRNLAFDGIQSDGRGGLLENRRCPQCGSSLGRTILPIHALEICQQFADVHARSLEAISSSVHVAQTQMIGMRRRSRS